MKSMSPENVLKKALEDIKKTGIDGLKPYLTVGGKKKFDTLKILSGGMGMFMSQSGQGNAMGFLLEHMSDCEWSVKDVIKGSENAKGIVGFKYEDILEGTLELSMIKEEKEWKIDDLKMPTFDKFSRSGNQ